MPLKINSWVDEVNGGLVWVLTAAAAQELVLGAGPARSSKGPPSVAQAPSELNRLLCWPSEPAVTHTLKRYTGRTHTHTQKYMDMQIQHKHRNKSSDPRAPSC